MANEGVRIFKGLQVEDNPTVISKEMTPDCVNVRVDNPIGCLNNEIGMRKLNKLAFDGPIISIHQPSVHSYTQRGDDELDLPDIVTVEGDGSVWGNETQETQTWRTYTLTGMSNFRKMAYDPKSKRIVGLGSIGFWQTNPYSRDGKLEENILTEYQVHDVCFTMDGYLWASTDNGILVIDRNWNIVNTIIFSPARYGKLCSNGSQVLVTRSGSIDSSPYSAGATLLNLDGSIFGSWSVSSFYGIDDVGALVNTGLPDPDPERNIPSGWGIVVQDQGPHLPEGYKYTVVDLMNGATLGKDGQYPNCHEGEGHIYVFDTANSRIGRLDSNYDIDTTFGSNGDGYEEFSNVQAMAFDGDYIIAGDGGNERMSIFLESELSA